MQEVQKHLSNMKNKRTKKANDLNSFCFFSLYLQQFHYDYKDAACTLFSLCPSYLLTHKQQTAVCRLSLCCKLMERREVYREAL